MCISKFSNRSVAAKDPLTAAADLFRGSLNTLHSGNLYQIFTYVKNKDAEFGDEPHRVSGMLLYAATDKAIQPDNSYRMSGNQISVKTLDLNLDFSEIAAQLNAIVNKHFG